MLSHNLQSMCTSYHAPNIFHITLNAARASLIPYPILDSWLGQEQTDDRISFDMDLLEARDATQNCSFSMMLI